MMNMLSVNGHSINDDRHKLRACPLWATTSCAWKTR